MHLNILYPFCFTGEWWFWNLNLFTSLKEICFKWRFHIKWLGFYAASLIIHRYSVDLLLSGLVATSRGLFLPKERKEDRIACFSLVDLYWLNFLKLASCNFQIIYAINFNRVYKGKEQHRCHWAQCAHCTCGNAWKTCHSRSRMA